MFIQYSGGLHCEIKHGPSGSTLETDAPKDNQGKGERFSPTDLVGAALASCVITTMAMAAERDGFSMKGASAEVEKQMVAHPRRIGGLPLMITLPIAIPAEYRPKLEQIAHSCPVSKSLHPEVELAVTFRYI
jgi:putative redox protein